MIELKVSLLNIKKPNDVVKALNEMISDMSFITRIVRVRAVTNGNHLGYGLVQIEEQLSNPLTDTMNQVSIITHDIIVAFQKNDMVKRVEICDIGNEITDYFLYNYDVIGGNVRDNYITINKLT